MIALSRIRLYQPDEKLKQRIGSDAEPLSTYINGLKQRATTFWLHVERSSAQGVLVGVGIKPSGKVRIWAEAIGGEIRGELLQAFADVLEQCPLPPVSNGPIAFAMEFGLWNQTPAEFPMIPTAWQEAVKAAGKPLLVPDGVFAAIWPD